MRSRRWTAIVLVACMGACSSAPPPIPALMSGVNPMERNAINALDLNLAQQASEGLDAALRRYESLDDLAGQWRIHLIKARIARARGDVTTAEQEADRLESLARLLNSREADYETLVLLGEIRSESRYFESALSIAGSKVQRAVALTYLDRVDEAIALVDDTGVDHPDDRAFVLFRYALKTGSTQDLERALAAYRRAKDSRGVADTLVHLSRLAAHRGDLAQARMYGLRAVSVLESVGDGSRASAVKRWLGQL